MTAIQNRFRDSCGFSVTKTIKGKTLPPPPICPGQEEYKFHDEDSAENIVFVGETELRPVIKAGTIEKLVERLTYEKYPDPEFTKTFLLTYRTFTSPKKLLNMLIGRYHFKPKPEVTDIEEWNNSVLKPVRLRVFNVLKNWLLNGFYDFSDNPKLSTRFIDFIEDDMQVDLSSAASSLKKVFDRQMNEARQDRSFVFSKKPPKPILPKTMPESLHVLEFAPEEIARQLTIIESELYRAIKPWEFLNQAWAKKDKNKRAPRVIAMINRFNQVSNWVASTILRTESLRTRISVLKHFIDIACKCMALNNFNAVTEIISGLQASAVYRLKQTWNAIGSKYTKMLEDCQNIMSHEQSYKNFRGHLHSVDPPVIPYLGVYLTDLTFIEDGNGDYIMPGKLINFVKRQYVSQVIGEIQQYQNDPYVLEVVPELQDWLRNVDFIPEEEMFDISLALESRGGSKVKKSGKKKQIDSRTASIYGELEDIPGYLFYEPDMVTNIETQDTTDGKQTIVAGTLAKLVERLTYETYPDPNYVAAFLMTYRSFTTPSDLLDMLIMRYNMPKPKNPSKEQSKQFTQEKMIPIHFRVFNVLKLWTERYASDFREDTLLVQRVLDFVESVVQSNKMLVKAGQAILNTLKKIESIPTPRLRFMEFGSQGVQSAELSWNPISWNILEYNVNVFAEQIFLNTYRIFTALQSRECLQKDWPTRLGRIVAPHLYLMDKNTDALLRWIKAEIYWTSDIRVRVKTTGFFLELAQRLLQLGDYHDCFIILKIMETLAACREFELVWDWLDLKHVRIWNEIKGINPRGNFKSSEDGRVGSIRTQIPYYEPELVQFCDIIQHIPDNTPNGLINFEKRANIHATYAFLARAQMCCNGLPDIQQNEEIISFLQRIPTPSDEQLDYALKHINNAPPEGISPAEQQRQREAAKNEALIHSKLSESLNELFCNDRGFSRIMDELFREELLDGVIEPIENSLAMFCQLSDLMMKIIINMGSDCELAEQRVQELMQEMAIVLYPNHEISTWSQHDENGMVYGEPGEIAVVLATSDEEIIVVEVQYSLEPHDIKKLQNLQEFYQKKEGKKAKTCVITCKIDETLRKRVEDEFDVVVI